MKGKKSQISYNSHVESLDRFNKLNINDQNELIKDILKDAYGGREKVKAECLLKIENFAKSKEVGKLKLDNSVTVENDGNNLIFSYSRTKVLPIFVFYIGLLVILSSAATFSYLQDMKISKLNIDIDGDGIADLNIDTNNDEVAEVNISKDGKKPLYNIDYMNNHVSVFNILNEDGSISNEINNDTDNDGVCNLNCDTDNDGWPDMNLDLDGDGVADMFIDSLNKGYANLNLDVNGDGECDIQCDTDNDGVCNNYCLGLDTLKYLDFNEIKKNNINILSTIPAINVTGEEIVCNNLYPTDQPNEGAKKECTTKLTIQNISSIDVTYSLDFNIVTNTYTSNNFKYKITSTNGGGNINNYTTTPKSGTTTLFNNVVVKAGITQEYNVSFILEGTGEEQNYDANRLFNGNFSVNIIQ
jgi:hypothetical protein